MQILERHLEDNIFDLHKRLRDKTFKHGIYKEFYVNDPKRRHIHKSNACDRVLHHLLYKHLYEVFDKKFIFDSYSCRKGKGTHKAVKRLVNLARKVSGNYTGDCWALKLDIKKFFDSIDHNIIKGLVRKSVKDQNINRLIDEVIDSFHSEAGGDKGIPLGNLTSQIFANIYLNELDQFIKHNLRIKYYLRYADDFSILDTDIEKLNSYLALVRNFLQDKLKLELHPNKISFRKLKWGIDFCGYTVLPHYILPRTKTKKRIINKIGSEEVSNQALQSYFGYFSHANGHEIQEYLKNLYWLKGAYDGA